MLSFERVLRGRRGNVMMIVWYREIQNGMGLFKLFAHGGYKSRHVVNHRQMPQQFSSLVNTVICAQPYPATPFSDDPKLASQADIIQ